MEPEGATSPKSVVSDVDLAHLLNEEPAEVEDLFENASAAPEISIDALGNQTEKKDKKDKKSKKDKKRKRSHGSLSSDDEKPLTESVGSGAKDSKATHQNQLAKSPQDFLSELMEAHKVICELCGTESTAQDAWKESALPQQSDFHMFE